MAGEPDPVVFLPGIQRQLDPLFVQQVGGDIAQLLEGEVSGPGCESSGGAAIYRFGIVALPSLSAQPPVSGILYGDILGLSGGSTLGFFVCNLEQPALDWIAPVALRMRKFLCVFLGSRLEGHPAAPTLPVKVKDFKAVAALALVVPVVFVGTGGVSGQ